MFQRSMPSSSPPSDSSKRTLSELECFVLGLIWKYGPCTAYSVRLRLQTSPSTQWSGSAGSVYPLVQRLARMGLLKSRAAARGRRASLEYTATPKGIAALRAWIGPPLPAEAVTVTHDPLRSRLRFLAALPVEQRRAWIEAAVQSLTVVARRVRQWEQAHGSESDAFDDLLTRSGLLDVKARKTWLREALLKGDAHARVV